MTVSDFGIGCVVLAAGESSRLGRPKALIDIMGEPLISWITGRLVKLGFAPVIVTRMEIYDAIKNSVGDVDVVINQRPELGRTGTVKEGLKFINDKYGGGLDILIVPVDRPGFSLSTVELLISKEDSTCPTYGGKGGHPLLVSKQDCNKIMMARSDAPLNRVISPRRMPVNDKYLHFNLDTKKDVDEFLMVVKFLRESDTHREAT